MTTFRGRVPVKLDPKGRLSFPTQFRSAIGAKSHLVMTNSLFRGEKCIDVYPVQRWNRLMQQFAELPDFDPAIQEYKRFYLASGEDCNLDSQGRVLVPQVLRDFAGLKENIVVVGMGDKFEIWDEGAWQSIFGQLMANFDETTKALAELQRAGHLGQGDKSHQGDKLQASKRQGNKKPGKGS